MTISSVRLELARNPGFPEGSAEHGYEMHLPLAADGHIDIESWRRHRAICTVRRFWGTEAEERGHLMHARDGSWRFTYDLDADPEPDEPIFRFDSHLFKIGEYLTVTEPDGQPMTFRVVEVRPTGI